MTAALATILLSALVLALCVTGEPTPEARTPAEMCDAIRSLGWKVATLRTAGVLVALVALIAGCLAILTATLCWHVCDLGGHAPVTLLEARS